MKAKQIYKISALAHKWSGITIGIQVLLWIVGGLYMSWFDITVVRGNHLVENVAPIEISAESHNQSGLQTWLDGYQQPIVGYRAASLHGEPVFIVDGVLETIVLDGPTGAQLSPFKTDWATAAAAKLYIGDGEITGAEINTDNFPDIKGDEPLWKVRFDDSDNTVLYLDPDSGALRAVRTDIWRIFDIMWMLHIMDYDDRSDISNPLLISFSIASLFFMISGFILVWFRFNRRDFKWILPKK